MKTEKSADLAGISLARNSQAQPYAEKNTSNKNKVTWALLTVLFLVAFGTLLWNSFRLFILLPAETSDLGHWANFGGGFGFANSVVSFCTFIALIWTLHLQKTAIDLQGQSLNMTREEMIQAQKEYEETVILSSQTALLNAYCQHMQWYLEESANRTHDERVRAARRIENNALAAEQNKDTRHNEPASRNNQSVPRVEETKSTMSDNQFAFFKQQGHLIGDKHWRIIHDMEETIERKKEMQKNGGRSV